MTCGCSVPTLSLTFLSLRVLAVALLNRTVRHLRPAASFRHSLCIWCANSRVGARITALTPRPPSFFILDIGEPRADMMGVRYARVLPVPVGEMAARSRCCSKSHQHPQNHKKERLAGSPRAELGSHEPGFQ